jgi:hypothetical protein
MLSADGQPPSALVVDDPYLYWIEAGDQNEADGVIKRARKDGTGAPMVVIDHLAYPTALAFDASAIYWTAMGTQDVAFHNGAVMRLAK